MTKDRRSTFRCARLAAAALALGIFSTAGLAGVNAQDASPEATPAVACVSPGLPPGTPTPMDDTADIDTGTPDTADTVADEAVDDAAMGTPEAATGEAAAPVGTAADDATSAAVIAVLQNYVACYNEGQATGDPGLYVALESQSYVESQGYATRYDRVADELSATFSTATLLDADNVQTWDDGRVSVDAQLLIGDYWYNHWRIIFAQGEDGTWLYDGQSNLPPTPDADFVAVNGLNLTDATDDGSTALVAFSGSTDFAQIDAIVFNITNSLTESYSVAALQLPEGADPAGLLDGSVSFDDVTILGAADSIEADGSGDLVLIGLPAGSYAFVAFPDAPDSTASPMVTPFTIVAAES